MVYVLATTGAMPFSGGYLEQPVRWQEAIYEWLPYWIDQLTIRKALVEQGKVDPVPSPAGEEDEQEKPLITRAMQAFSNFMKR